MRLMKNHKYINLIFRYGLFVWIICSIILGSFHNWCINRGCTYDSIWFFGYNNPLVLLSSVSLFCWFSTKQINSKVINFIAGGTFAVYLVSTKEFGQLNIGTNGLLVYEDFSYLGVVVYSTILTIVLYLPCSIICWLCKKIPIPKSHR